MNTTQSRLGTKETLRTWLSSIKHLSYTQYCKLPTERKKQIQDEYKGRVQTCRSTVIVQEKKHESGEN